MSVTLDAAAETDAFAIVIAELIRQNLADHPEKRADLAQMQGRVALVAEDAGTTITLRFRDGALVVHSGLFGVPDLVIRGPGEALIDLSRVPNHPRLKFLPDYRSPVARSLARALAERKLRIHGLAGHLRLALRLSHVLSIH
ncbi:MAG TPA: SCP2 sterol-binding domain-containing protein [Polyangiales bacterium]